MHLLPKSEVLIKKATAQKQAIDEGVKLTKRIDRLREVAAAEDASLEKFRSETIAEIHRQTTEAATKRDELLGEVKYLEDRKKEALVPLTEKENALKEYENVLNTREDLVRIELIAIENMRKETEEAHFKVQDTFLYATQKEQRAHELLEKADEEKKQAGMLITEASKNHEQSVILKEKTESSLAERQNELDSRADLLSKKEQSLEEERKALLSERIKLLDRQAALEREFTRLKKQ